MEWSGLRWSFMLLYFTHMSKPINGIATKILWCRTVYRISLVILNFIIYNQPLSHMVLKNLFLEWLETSTQYPVSLIWSVGVILYTGNQWLTNGVLWHGLCSESSSWHWQLVPLLWKGYHTFSAKLLIDLFHSPKASSWDLKSFIHFFGVC